MKSNMLKSIVLVFFISMFLASCGSRIEGDRVKSDEAGEALVGEGTRFVVDPAGSSIAWVGSKPTGTHNGTIAVMEGFVLLGEETITGGEFIIDMSSIVVLDLTDPKMNGDLRGHLLSADFFEVETYPTAKFVITGAESLGGGNHAIAGNLTMKDSERSITFNAQVDVVNGSLQAISMPFVIDRSEWNVRYGSRKFFDDLKDNFINDEMGLTISLLANKE